MASIKTAIKIKQGDSNACIDGDNYVSISCIGFYLHDKTPEEIVEIFENLQDIIETVKHHITDNHGSRF